MGLARAFEAQGRWEDAGREWQSVLESRGEILRDGFPPDLVLAWLGLGHARENQGQSGQALQYYQHVVDAWREADLVAPLADARSAIRRLAEKTPQ
jgi:tetratricopeptide (TPR) repeat protein